MALLLVFYQSAGFLKFPPQTVMLLGQCMPLGLLSAAVYGELAEHAHRTGNLYPSVFALYASMTPSVGILRGRQSGYTGGVVTHERATHNVLVEKPITVTRVEMEEKRPMVKQRL